MGALGRVLIADHSLLFRNKLKRILENNGIMVLGMVDNGFEAISLYKELRPNLVIIDSMLTGINGIQTVKLLKEFDPESRVLMFSALATREAIMECLSAGAAHCVLKPFDEEKIVHTIRKLLGE